MLLIDAGHPVFDYSPHHEITPYSNASAKSLIEDCKLSGKSLTYNKNGPRAVPWGTPEVTGMGLEHLPSQITDWERSVRKDSNHESRVPCIP